MQDARVSRIIVQDAGLSVNTHIVSTLKLGQLKSYGEVFTGNKRAFSGSKPFEEIQ